MIVLLYAILYIGLHIILVHNYQFIITFNKLKKYASGDNFLLCFLCLLQQFACHLYTWGKIYRSAVLKHLKLDVITYENNNYNNNNTDCSDNNFSNNNNKSYNIKYIFVHKDVDCHIPWRTYFIVMPSAIFNWIYLNLQFNLQISQ